MAITARASDISGLKSVRRSDDDPVMSMGPRHGAQASGQTAGKCSACGARRRPDEAWCSLCHTPVHTAAGLAQHDLEPDPAAQPARPAQNEPRPALDPAVAAVADQLLAELAAAETQRERDSGFGSLRLRLGRLSPRGAALVVAGVGGLLLLVLTILGLTLIGLLI